MDNMSVYPMREVTVHSSEQEIMESLELANMPNYMCAPMMRWIKYGRVPGNFLQALLKNDLCDTINRADALNLTHMYTWVKWLQNAAPSGCYGSVEKFDEWSRDRQRDSKEGP